MAAKEAIAGMERAIEAVDQSTFQPDTLKLWGEFSNRLMNGLKIAGRQLPKNVQQSARIATRSAEEAGRYLGLPTRTEAPPKVDPVIAGALEEIIKTYLPLSKALADDAPEKAQAAARDFSKASGKIPLTEDAKYLQENANALAGEGDISKQRVVFQNISNRLISLVRSYGLDQVGSAYVVHCPMVADGKGGDWISNAPEVLNPYFGDAMLNCGSVTSTLSLGEKPPMKKMEGMEKHNHGK